MANGKGGGSHVANHFWVGSLCLWAPAARNGRPPSYPSGVTAVSDTLTIVEDIGNHIPDKSWMLYLLELFDKDTEAPVELNLICQFNSRDNFWAIFRGINRYKFASVLPAVGHSYMREIIMQREKKSIEYSLTDLSTEQKETFSLDVSSDKGFSYEGGSHFTGIEWWNKADGGNCPFPVRYRVKVSSLCFGQKGTPPVYSPYNVLVPNRDGVSGVEYPVSFENPSVRDKSIRYAVAPGKTAAGIHFRQDMPEAV
jgi:hypothetical protein